MKVGDWVRHKELGWIGQITDISKLSTIRNRTDNGYGKVLYAYHLFDIRFYDEHNRKRHAVCDEEEIVPHSLEKKGNHYPLSDWLSNPNQKLRNALARKQEQLHLARLRKRPQRMDGRHR